MAKPPDKSDSTQPLSESQVVAVTPKPPAPRPGGPNDQSVAWKGTVVSADDFAPRPARTGAGKRVVIGVVAAAALGGGAFALWPKQAPTAGNQKSDAAPVAIPVAASDAAIPAVAADAAAPAVAADAAPEPLAIDAAAPDDAAVAPAIDAGKPTGKKKPVKWPPVKKRPPVKHH